MQLRLITNSLCWARFERFSGGHYSQAVVCWMFKKAKVAWDLLLYASVTKIIERYGIKKGIVVIDDSDTERSKNTTQVAKVHKIRDKKHAVFFNGQSLIFLLLVTESVTIPVGFCFYEPDPALSAWNKEDRRLREKEVAKKFCPAKPERNADYPTKIALGLKLLETFKKNFDWIQIKATLADTFYGSKEFFEEAARITEQAQVISQIKKSQLINVNGKFIQAEKFFATYGGKKASSGFFKIPVSPLANTAASVLLGSDVPLEVCRTLKN